jgi:hypothetical protein
MPEVRKAALISHRSSVLMLVARNCGSVPVVIPGHRDGITRLEA